VTTLISPTITSLVFKPFIDLLIISLSRERERERLSPRVKRTESGVGGKVGEGAFAYGVVWEEESLRACMLNLDLQDSIPQNMLPLSPLQVPLNLIFSFSFFKL
jgi:hypothetical protein